MIGEIALDADAVDSGKTIHPHPMLGGSLGRVVEVAHRGCTNLQSRLK